MPNSLRATRLAGKYALVACAVVVAAGAVSFTPSMFALSNLTLAQYSVVAGGAMTGTATLSQATPVVTVISFKSSNARVVSVPVSAPVPPNSNRATIVVRGLAAGCADITSIHAGTTRTQQMVVHPVPATTLFNLSVPNSLLLLGAQPATGTVSGFNPAMSGQAVSLSSSNPSVVTVPASRALVRGRASFPITIVGEGCATITVRMGPQSLGKTVRSIYIGG